MTDEVSELTSSLLVEQIMLRGMMVEVVKLFAKLSANPDVTIREFGEGLQQFVNGYDLPAANKHMMEQAKERVRMNIDAAILLASYGGAK